CLCFIGTLVVPLLLPVSLRRPASSSPSTLSLHDALPISPPRCGPSDALASASLPGTRPLWRAPGRRLRDRPRGAAGGIPSRPGADRKSTRLNSSHQIISYAVFCLNKKNNHCTTHEMYATF